MGVIVREAAADKRQDADRQSSAPPPGIEAQPAWLANKLQEPLMVGPQQPDLLHVDWSQIPAPQDDGAAAHLAGMPVPDVELQATNGAAVSLSKLPGRTVVYVYPRTGLPGEVSIVEDWDMIPGARGCTPQSCAFRDHHAALMAAGAAHVFGLSVQDTAYQREVVQRLHLPFALLSDEALQLTTVLRLPTMEAGDLLLLKRLAMVLDDGVITKVFYPVFPPDRNAADVLDWLRVPGKAV